jgi:hypothetical protein
VIIDSLVIGDLLGDWTGNGPPVPIRQQIANQESPVINESTITNQESTILVQ